MSQVRDEEGKYREQTSVDAVLEVLKTAHEPLTATEIADQLGITSRTALNKLNELTERNPTVIRKEVGASAVIWFIRHGAVHEQAFEDFADRLTGEFGEEIEQIILYGSVARGEAREDSDVDVLIVTSTEQARETIADRASAVAFEVMLEYDVIVSPMYVISDEFEQQENSPHLTNVRREGRVYDG
jgi:predicted nucleotidyltransferase/DNA-binding CsgD family transcriptional regulator